MYHIFDSESYQNRVCYRHNLASQRDMLLPLVRTVGAWYKPFVMTVARGFLITKNKELYHNETNRNIPEYYERYIHGYAYRLPHRGNAQRRSARLYHTFGIPPEKCFAVLYVRFGNNQIAHAVIRRFTHTRRNIPPDNNDVFKNALFNDIFGLMPEKGAKQWLNG